MSLIDSLVRVKVGEVTKEAFEEGVECLCSLHTLREIARENDKYVDEGKVNEAMAAQFVILEMMIDMLVFPDGVTAPPAVFREALDMLKREIMEDSE
jgi:hypothetical protein